MYGKRQVTSAKIDYVEEHSNSIDKMKIPNQANSHSKLRMIGSMTKLSPKIDVVGKEKDEILSKITPLSLRKTVPFE